MQLGIKLGVTQLGGGDRRPVIRFDLKTLTPKVGSCEALFTPPSGVTVVSYEAVCREANGGLYRTYPVVTSPAAAGNLLGVFDQYGGVLWDVSLTGVTDDGRRVYSNTVEVQAAPQDPPAVPVLTDARSSGHSVYLTFEKPASDFPIEYYEETLNYQGEDYIYRMTYVTEANNTVTALALSPAGTFQYRVRAINKSGTSNWSLPIEGTADLYPPQLTIDSYASIPTGVTLDFALPIDISSGDTFYVQGYGFKGDTVDSTFVIDRQDSITVRGTIALPSKDTWILAIRSVNEYGNGAWSGEFEVVYSGSSSVNKLLTPVRAFAGRKIIVVNDDVDVGRLGTEADDYIIT